MAPPLPRFSARNAYFLAWHGPQLFVVVIKETSSAVTAFIVLI
jgi:hypothetical protein